MTDTGRHDDRGAEAGAPDGAGAPEPSGARSSESDEPSSPHGGAAQSTNQPQPTGGRGSDYETGGVRLALLIGFFGAIGLLWGWPILLVVLGIVVMIFLHELGHFATAKWTGMKATEFFIGFGPKIWAFQRGETTYGVKAIWAGAYVRIVGMNNLDEVDPADEHRTYRQQSFPKRLLVVSAGSLMHFAQAFVLLVLLLGVVGLPGGSLTDRDIRGWEVLEITADSAAAQAGLEDGDRIVTIDGAPASEHQSFAEFISGREVGDDLVLEVERDGEVREVTAELGRRPADVEGPAGGPFLGVAAAPELDDEPVGIGTALVRAPGELASLTGHTVGALVGLFSPGGLSDFAGQVTTSGDPDAPGTDPGSRPSAEDGDGNRLISIFGAVRIGAQLSETGMAGFLGFFILINVFIGIFNMVPLPPLDGGHAAVAIYERARSRRGRPYHADVAKLLPLTYAVLMGLVIIGVSAIYLDIVNPIDL
jgi:membrane-associated protease RseP (regulator of RpoE activity)